MALNGSRQAIIDHRRQFVARLRLRGYTMREIHSAMGNNPNYRNPDSGEPWSVATIGNDCKALSDEWREAASIDIDQHKANILAEIAELKRQGWSQNDLDLVLKAIKRECDLRGLDAPSKSEFSGPGGGPVSVGIEVIEIVKDYGSGGDN